MNNLSIILGQAKNEIEMTFDFEIKLKDFNEQGFYFEALNNKYKLIISKDNNITFDIEDDTDTIYTHTFEAVQTMADVCSQLDKEITINEALESIESGWLDTMVAGGSHINFFDYSELLDEIKEKAQQKGINATIEATFSGLSWEYNR